MFRFRLSAEDEIVDMIIRLFTGGRIRAVVTVFHIQLVRSCLSSSKWNSSKLYLNMCPFLVHSSGSPLTSFLCLLVLVICIILLRSLMAFADICFSLFVDPISDMAAANSAAVDAGGFPRFPPQYLVHEYFRRLSGSLDARRFAILLFRSTLTVTIALAECETAYAGWQRRWKHWDCRRTEDDHTHGKCICMTFVRSVEKVFLEKRLAGLVSKYRGD